MRTTLDLDDALVEALQARYPGLSRTEAIEQTIRAYLRADASEGLMALAGSFEIDDLAAQLRKADRPGR